MTKSAIQAAVKAYLDKNDWHYKVDEDGDINAGVNLKSKLGSAKLVIYFNDSGYTVYGVAPLKADEESRAETAKYLHMCNYGKRNGNFELDFRDGEVRYKTYVNTDGMTVIPEDDVIKDSILIPFFELDRAGNSLAAIMMGFSDADTERAKEKK